MYISMLLIKNECFLICSKYHIFCLQLWNKMRIFHEIPLISPVLYVAVSVKYDQGCSAGLCNLHAFSLVRNETHNAAGSRAVGHRGSRSSAKSSDLICESSREVRGCSQFQLHSELININAGVSRNPAETPLCGIFILPVFITPLMYFPNALITL